MKKLMSFPMLYLLWMTFPRVPTDSADQLFTPAQLSAIQDTVLSSISAALTNLPHSGNLPLDLTSSSTRSRHASNMATPLGINRPTSQCLNLTVVHSSKTSKNCPNLVLWTSKVTVAQKIIAFVLY